MCNRRCRCLCHEDVSSLWTVLCLPRPFPRALKPSTSCRTMSSSTPPRVVSALDSTYGSPSRRSRVRYLSPASLNLERVFEQNRQRLQQRDGGKQADIVAPLPPKGKPRLLLMDQRRYLSLSTNSRSRELTIPRSGKSSISSVVFHKLPPSETLFLESTARIQKDAMT